MKILMINPYGIGDVLFTTPMISPLRKAYPRAMIAYLANRRTAAFLEKHPDVQQVFVYERDEFVALWRKNPFGFIQRWWVLIQDIKRQKFDLVFDFSINSTFGFLAWVSGIKKRIGYDYRGRGRFLTDTIPLKGYEEKHMIEYYLDLLSFVQVSATLTQGRMSLPVGPQEALWAKNWLQQQGIDDSKPLIAVVPGGGASWGKAASYKLWPAAKYADLVHKIIEKYDAAVILMGDLADKPLCLQVARGVHFPLHLAVGKTSVLEMAAVFKHCRLVLVNDGGPLHVAVAVGTKTVSIFGPVDPKVYGPYPPQDHTIITKHCACQPCYRRFRMSQCSHISCLRDLSVEEVYQKVQEVL